MTKYITYLFLALLMFSSFTLQASELFGKISYKGSPLKNAEISVQDKKVKTNDIGFYSVKLEPGSYVLGIKLPDGATRSEKVDVFPQDTERNLKLE